MVFPGASSQTEVPLQQLRDSFQLQVPSSLHLLLSHTSLVWRNGKFYAIFLGSLQKHLGLSCIRAYFLCFEPAEITVQAQHDCPSMCICLLTWTASPHLSQSGGTTLPEITMKKGRTISPPYSTKWKYHYPANITAFIHQYLLENMR